MDQQLIMQLQSLHQQGEELEQQLQIVDTQMNELEVFKNSIDALEKADETEMLATLGRGVFVKTDITDKKLFVEVGNGYLVRKTPEEAGKIIAGQIGRLGEFKVQIVEQLDTINTELRQQMHALESANQPA